jgi:hypothetical protein
MPTVATVELTTMTQLARPRTVPTTAAEATVAVAQGTTATVTTTIRHSNLTTTRI